MEEAAGGSCLTSSMASSDIISEPSEKARSISAFEISFEMSRRSSLCALPMALESPPALALAPPSALLGRGDGLLDDEEAPPSVMIVIGSCLGTHEPGAGLVVLA